MKKRFLILMFIALLVGCSNSDISQVAESGPTPIVTPEPTEPPVVEPEPPVEPEPTPEPVVDPEPVVKTFVWDQSRWE